MNDDIHPYEYRSVVGPAAQSKQLEDRDKFFIKYGIALGLGAAVTESHDVSDQRIDQVYRNRLLVNRKNGIKL